MREKFLLVAAALAAFGLSLAGPFQFDDLSLLNDPSVASHSGWWESWRLEQTRPLTWFTFWANYEVAGEHPLLYHAINLALHIAIVLLLLDVLAKLIPPTAAFAAALIFAIHPALAEPVVYIFARGTLLATLFSLLTIRSWTRDRPWPAVAFFALAVLSKEECVALPFVLLLLSRDRKGAVEKAPLAAMLSIALLLGARVLWAASTTPGSQAGPQAGISPASYFAAQGPVIWRYLFRLIIPWGFSPDYDIAIPPLWLAAIAWTALLALAILALKAPRIGPWFVSGLILLLPSSSLLPAADLAADRRMYLPMIAFAPCLGLLLEYLHRRALIVVAVLLIPLSVQYTNVWRTPENLWSQAVNHAPSHVRNWIQLSRAVEPDRSGGYLQEAERLFPDDPSIPTEKGRRGLAENPRAALPEFGRALALDPSNPAALNNRGAALAALGQPEAARADFERALARNPCLFDARLNLARMGIPTPSQGCRYSDRQRSQLASAEERAF